MNKSNALIGSKEFLITGGFNVQLPKLMITAVVWCEH